MRLLYTSIDVRSEIARLMRASKLRRVAIVAFVNAGSNAMIPRPDGVKIICWPKPGATDPKVINSLLKKGALVQFSDNLHMKLYWAEGRGAVITSANLSNNALGSGGLKEIGVLLSSKDVEIDSLIKSVKPYDVSTSNMRKLEIQHRKLIASGLPYVKVPQGDFLEWYTDPKRAEWKFSWWDDRAEFCRNAKIVAKADYDLSEPYDFMACKKGEFKVGDFLLSYKITRRLISDPVWIYVDRVVKTIPSERAIYDRRYPYQAVQMFRPSKYRSPFRITSKFKKAFKKVIGKLGYDRIKANSTFPAKSVIDQIRDEMQK